MSAIKVRKFNLILVIEVEHLRYGRLPSHPVLVQAVVQVRLARDSHEHDVVGWVGLVGVAGGFPFEDPVEVLV